MSDIPSNTTVLAIDLIDTLVDRGEDLFAQRSSDYLRGRGIIISPSAFHGYFRKRYLEYSLGNFVDDEEFLGSVFMHFLKSNQDWTPFVEPIIEMRIECSFPFLDAQRFLDAASKNYSLYLASNFVNSWVNRILEKNDWQGFFKGKIVSSECRYRKPASNFFQEVINASNAKPSNVLFIGDSRVNDYWGATKFGMSCYLIDRKNSFPRTTVENLVVINSLDDLII